jgi:CubicO group peptidase (beta-lactamase class C family)
MKLQTVSGLICALILASGFAAAEQNDFIDSEATRINAFLQKNFSDTNCGMVIGLVDEHGSRVFSAGKLDNGTPAEVNGDTLFEIGSVTKTFTVLLLMDMVERGEMKLDDPVSKYLPASVKVPDYHGKQITLLNLAVQDSGLPFNATGVDDLATYNAFSVEDMYAFFSSYHLTIEPGAKFQYSNVGMSLLGHAIALKAGTNFESLVLDRICRPLHMDDTCFTVPAGLRARTSAGHGDAGKRGPGLQLQAYVPAGALHSTVNDLLKYVSANLGLTHTSLEPLMQKMQVIRHRDSPDMGSTAMPWYNQNAYVPLGSEFLGHAGGTFGSVSFVGLDKKQRRGVVALSNQTLIHSFSVGWRILQRVALNDTDAQKLLPVTEHVGLGISFDIDKQTRTLRITQIIPDTPAARAGLKPGPILQKINGTPTAGKSAAECLSLTRGPAGAKIQLELVSADGTQTNTVELTREKFRL